VTTNAFDPIRRPGLAYQHAFDWLALHLQAAGGPVAALAPQTFHGAELLRRLPYLPFLPPLPRGLARAAASLGLSAPTGSDPSAGPFHAVAWAEPPAEAGTRLSALARSLHPGGRLYLLAPGPLGRFLAERRHNSWDPRLPARQALRLLASRGWRIRQHLGLHGPRAVVHHYLGRLAARLGHNHRRDRRHFALRRDFVETGLSLRLAALILIAAEKPA
jgi:hypothetical protein